MQGQQKLLTSRDQQITNIATMLADLQLDMHSCWKAAQTDSESIDLPFPEAEKSDQFEGDRTRAFPLPGYSKAGGARQGHTVLTQNIAAMNDTEFRPGHDPKRPMVVPDPSLRRALQEGRFGVAVCH